MLQEESKEVVLREESKEVVNTAAKKHIRKIKNQKQSWLTTETLSVADERRQAKVTGDSGRWERPIVHEKTRTLTLTAGVVRWRKIKLTQRRLTRPCKK